MTVYAPDIIDSTPSPVWTPPEFEPVPFEAPFDPPQIPYSSPVWESPPEEVPPQESPISEPPNADSPSEPPVDSPIEFPPDNPDNPDSPIESPNIEVPQAAPAVVCAGVAPILGFNENGTVVANCWQGYWVIPSSVSLDAVNYNIEGRIVVRGDFTLEEGASLSWRGFPGETDSRPDIPLKRFESMSHATSGRAFILSHVNVTGTLTVRGTIHVNISDANLEQIIGDVDPANPKRVVGQRIVESDNDLQPIQLQTASGSSESCRIVGVSTEASRTASGRGQLSAIFTIDDSNCVEAGSKKKNNDSRKIAAIVAPIVVACVILGVILLAVMSRKTDWFKAAVRPFSRRKFNTISASAGMLSSGSADLMDMSDGPQVEEDVVSSEGQQPSQEQDRELSASLESSPDTPSSSLERHSDIAPEDSY
jgi:hypothetical protein